MQRVEKNVNKGPVWSVLGLYKKKGNHGAKKKSDNHFNKKKLINPTNLL